MEVSAPGKVHLIGEHSVVYGEPAIMAAVGLRTTVSLEKGDKVVYKDERFGDDLEWDVSDVLESAAKVRSLWEKCATEKNFSPLFQAVRENRFSVYKKVALGTVMNAAGIGEGFSVNVDSKLPVGSGLGSSASLAACLSKGIPGLFGKDLGLGEMNEIAFEIEKLVHGSPGGADNAACVHGGLIWFQRPDTIVSLKEEIPYRLENFVLVYTVPPKRTTGELVQHVRDLDPGVRDPIIRNLGLGAFEMRSVLGSRNFPRMKELINLTQQNLASLGISVPEINQVNQAVRSIGGAAKGCGALGGGIVLAYHEDKGRLLDKIRELGFRPMEADLGVEGVRLDK